MLSSLGYGPVALIVGGLGLLGSGLYDIVTRPDPYSVKYKHENYPLPPDHSVRGSFKAIAGTAAAVKGHSMLGKKVEVLSPKPKEPDFDEPGTSWPDLSLFRVSKEGEQETTKAQEPIPLPQVPPPQATVTHVESMADRIARLISAYD